MQFGLGVNCLNKDQDFKTKSDQTSGNFIVEVDGTRSNRNSSVAVTKILDPLGIPF